MRDSIEASHGSFEMGQMGGERKRQARLPHCVHAADIHVLFLAIGTGSRLRSLGGIYVTQKRQQKKTIQLKYSSICSGCELGVFIFAKGYGHVSTRANITQMTPWHFNGTSRISEGESGLKIDSNHPCLG
jgi:hypothetical protein